MIYTHSFSKQQFDIVVQIEKIYIDTNFVKLAARRLRSDMVKILIRTWIIRHNVDDEVSWKTCGTDINNLVNSSLHELKMYEKSRQFQLRYTATKTLLNSLSECKQ